MPPAASRWDPPQSTWSNRAAGQRLARSNPFLAFLPNRTHPDESRLPSTPIQSGLLRDKDEFSAVFALAPLAVLLFVRGLRPDACVVLPRGHLGSEEPPAAGHQHRQPDDRGHGKDAPCPVAGAAAASTGQTRRNSFARLSRRWWTGHLARRFESLIERNSQRRSSAACRALAPAHRCRGEPLPHCLGNGARKNRSVSSRRRFPASASCP